MFFSPSPTPCGGSDLLILIILFQNTNHYVLMLIISKRRVVAVLLLILIILFQNTNHSVLMSIISKRRVVAVPLLILDFSLIEYDSFIFDHSIDPFPPDDRSVSHHEEFVDELPHIISPSKYNRFYFDLEDDPVENTNHSVLMSIISKRRVVAVPLLILDFSLIEYDSFIFDHSIDPFPPDDRSVSHHEEFVDELPHIISPSKYNRFYFDLEDDPVEEHMAWQTDYCIMKEGMSTLRGRKSIPGMTSSEREMEKGYYSAFT
nr:hypothetical protein [Tanacetum cinerariifolium]